VDDPVKFMARKVEMARMMKNQAAISRYPARVPSQFDRKTIKTKVTRTPGIRPLREKARPGSHGRKRGSARPCQDGR